MTAETFLIMAACVGIGYPMLHALVMRATENVRLELADVGRDLLVAPDVSEKHKQFISDMLNDVFSWKFMAMATFAVPVLVLSPKRRTELSSDDRSFIARDDMRHFIDLHMKSVMAASPFWTVMFVIVFAVTVALTICWVGVSFLSDLWVDTIKHVSPNVHNARALLTRAPN